MQATDNLDMQVLARRVGWTFLGALVFGILAAIFVVGNIDINMTGDVVGTAENMLEAELRLKAKAYIGLALFALEAFISIGLYLLLRKNGLVLAGWSLFVSFASAILVLLGTMFAMNAAQFAGNEAYTTLTDGAGRLLLTSLQATSDYTSFHLGLVLSGAAKAGFYYLFLKSGLMPKIISAWGLFASVFMASAIVARDFIPFIGQDMITYAFMLSNLTAIISTGLYLAIRGVRQS